jgi:hypothetical protein
MTKILFDFFNALGPMKPFFRKNRLIPAKFFIRQNWPEGNNS